MMKKFFVYCVVAVLLYSVNSVFTEEKKGKSPEELKEEFKTKYETNVKKASQKHTEVGNTMYDYKMFVLAKDEYKRAYVIDPNNEKAIQRYNEVKDKKENDVKVEQEEGLKKVYYQKRDSIARDIANIFKDLANWCKKNNLIDEEKKALIWVLDYKYDDKDARERLNYVKKGNRWMKDWEAKIRDEIVNIYKPAVNGEENKDATNYEAAIGGKPLNKRKSANFFFVSVIPQKELADVLKYAETLRTWFHKVFEIENNPINKQITHVHVENKDQHKKFVDVFFGGDSFSKEANGVYNQELSEWTHRNVEGTKDNTIHTTTHILFGYLQGRQSPWLYEAMAYYFTEYVLSSTATYCVSKEVGTGGGGRAWTDSTSWRQLIREALLYRKDKAFSDIFEATLNKLNVEMTVKGWSLIDFLMKERKKEFFQFLSLLRSDKKEKDAIQEVFGWDMKKLEENWREWVRQNY